MSGNKDEICSGLLAKLMSETWSSKLEEYKTILSNKNVMSFLEDQELTETIEKFFENNLNVCQTSKKTFMHRNTLLYRIEKVKKLLGLDVRNFEDAVTLQIIMILQKLDKHKSEMRS